MAWDAGPGGDDIATLDEVAFTTSTTAILGSGITPTVDRFTIVRIRGLIAFNLTAATAGTDGYNFMCGIGTCTSDAFAVGVTALPNPFDD